MFLEHSSSNIVVYFTTLLFYSIFFDQINADFGVNKRLLSKHSTGIILEDLTGLWKRVLTYTKNNPGAYRWGAEKAFITSSEKESHLQLLELYFI